MHANLLFRVTCLLLTVVASTAIAQTDSYSGYVSVECNPYSLAIAKTEVPLAVSRSLTCPFPTAKSTASAAPGFNLKSSSSGSDTPLGHHAGSGAIVTETFTVSGNSSNRQIPVDFNFNVSGSMTVASGHRGISSAQVSFNAQSYSSGGGVESDNWAEMTSVNGVITSVQARGGFFASTTPILKIQTGFILDAVKQFLNGEQLDKVLGDAGVQALLKALQVPLTDPIWATGAGSDALLRRISDVLGSYKPIDATSFLDLLLGFDSEWSLSTTIASGGLMRVSLGTGVFPYPGPAVASADFGSTVVLQSITFAHGFDASGLDPIYVNFAGGDSFLVSTAVPEPSSLGMLFAGGLLLALVVAGRRRTRQS